MVAPLWGDDWLHDYSLLGERVGEMVMVFLLGKLVSWLLPTGGEGELHDYSPLGERAGEMVMIFLLGKLVSWLFPAGGEGGCMVTPRWGRGLLVHKINSVFLLC